jgi:hypothetical protein
MTTLTVPGAIPAGLPGTERNRPPGSSGPGGGRGRNRSRRKHQHRAAKGEGTPGNDTPRGVDSLPADEDFNR